MRAVWWRRLPLRSTRVWSGLSPRIVNGRTISVASETLCRGKLTDGASCERICAVAVVACDSTANCPALCGGHPWREKERKQWERQCSEQLLGRASHNTSLSGRISRTAKRPYARLPSSARKNRRTLKHAVRFKLELGELSAP